MLAARRPFQRPQAGLGDLSARHLGGHGIADAHPRLARLRRRAGGRQFQPFGGLDDVARHAKATVVEQPKRILREAVALLRGAAVCTAARF